ncbi:MAG: hypothetical protein OM95_05315 [Bdellovibrio sp. ArHS]|uniref:hypothetical protein n=1 Tax=Bdellovibrio sp. ArHS TaxID=1569284 RepID=UPI000583F392|nr:hypothetical protein [Bdellovibrio sp. ArHS]KHD89231.1 MAG: hypothetical protein OM95_05315 [Bdellovibrio sp. ArHS]
MKFLFLSFFLLSSTAQARVFNIQKETFAAYFLASGGASAIGTKALDGEAGATLSYGGNVNYNYSGEFGFLYSVRYLNFRFGFEILKPSALDSTANNGTDDLYSADSQILGYVPKVGLEVNLQSTNTYRSFVSASAGLANVTLKNAYTLTTAGQTAFPGVADHTAESKGTATSLQASLGYEGVLSDTTTILVEFGYRQLKIDNLKYTKDVTTFSGAKSSGDAVLTSTGEQRELDFSGGFISLGFRFYM